ncbi:MAG: rRNA pseudouridine synthase [Scytolyngbya sp. HA4215-MV1]|jgi:23S rRNA pseudouridine2605 synthase|nr:rRNA pseudouridine synthase [Scytolyngbya sp. HA4215-MV1]
MVERLQKILSQWGVASRRQAEQMIIDGRISLNGEVAHLGQKANPEIDRIQVDGVSLRSNERPSTIYLLLNKPGGIVSTNFDPQNRSTILDLLSPDLRHGKGIHSVGRLDADSTGALLLTNDGELTCHLTHPRYHISKTYEVWVKGHPSDSVLQTWRDGIWLSGKKTLPADVRLLQAGASQTLLKIVLREGRNRQIRRVAELLGHPVLGLHRTAIGGIRLQSFGEPSLPMGCYRFLKDSEISSLRSQIDLTFVNVPADMKEHSQ